MGRGATPPPLDRSPGSGARAPRLCPLAGGLRSRRPGHAARRGPRATRPWRGGPHRRALGRGLRGRSPPRRPEHPGQPDRGTGRRDPEDGPAPDPLLRLTEREIERPGGAHAAGEGDRRARAGGRHPGLDHLRAPAERRRHTLNCASGSLPAPPTIRTEAMRPGDAPLVARTARVTGPASPSAGG